MRLRVRGPSGLSTTLTILEDEEFGKLKELIGSLLNIENTDGIVLLVGFPPRPLVAEQATPVINVLRDGEVILVKEIADSLPTSSNADDGTPIRREQLHTSHCPPGIDEETWANLDEETKRELSFSVDEDEDGELDSDMEEDTNYNQKFKAELTGDVIRGSGDTDQNRVAGGVFQHNQWTNSSNANATKTTFKTSKSGGGISFGARVATLSSNGQASSVQKSTLGSRAQPRAFGAR